MPLSFQLPEGVLRRLQVAVALALMGSTACCMPTAARLREEELARQASMDEEMERALARAQQLDAAGQYPGAVAVLTQALRRRLAIAGEKDPRMMKGLEVLGDLYLRHQEPTRALAVYQHVLTLREALPTARAEVAGLLEKLIRLQQARRNLAAVLPLLERAFTVSEERLRQESFGFSEHRIASVLQQLRASEERIYSLVREYPNHAGLRKLALSVALLRKGRSIEELAQASLIINRGFVTQEDQRLFERLRAVRTQEMGLLFSVPAQREAQSQSALNLLAQQGEALEENLSERSAPWRGRRSLPSATKILSEVCTFLPQDSALIEFVAYRYEPFLPQTAPDSPAGGELRYLALLAFHDGRTHALDLGSGASIDEAATRLHAALDSSDSHYMVAARALYELVLPRLQPLLGGVRRLFLSPDGQLAVVPFAALFDGQRFLVDAFDLTYLTSGRDLLPRPGDLVSPGSVVAFVDPEFDPAPPAPDPQPPAGTRSVLLQQILAALPSRFSSQLWLRLPGTLKEGEAIHRLFPRTQLLQGKKATKQELLRLAAPSILHIATHGFFLDDTTSTENSRAPAAFGGLGGGAPAQPLTDPLLRSGLVLAGAHASAADSVVTALELAGLNLWGTQLVVLSACDTGRGDIKPGQGVYGLRRALMMAGAQTLVTSLWKINDATTRELMEVYYSELLTGQGRATAMRTAMRALRQKHPHPKYWAPFIVIGQDGPLKI